VEVANSRKHLFDETGTFCFGIVVVRLFVEAIEELSSNAKLLYEINFRVTLVYFFQPNNVRVIQLQQRDESQV
jgi:hypothetical protein